MASLDGGAHLRAAKIAAKHRASSTRKNIEQAYTFLDGSSLPVLSEKEFRNEEVPNLQPQL